MSQRRLPLSEYEGMWLFAMFDLPVVTATDRRNYARFRKKLLEEGFMMLQFSVYARYFPSEEASKGHRRRIRAALPPGGHVRLLHVTDHQFGKMEVYISQKREKPEEPPAQLTLL